MTDHPEIPDVVNDSPAVMGEAAIVLWTSLTRCLVEKGVLSADEVQGVISAAHTELSHEKGSGAVMALLARLAMNAS